MDGVLTDTEPIHQRAELKMFDLLGINISREMHNNFVGSSDLSMWREIAKSQQLPYTIPQLLQLKRSIYLEYLKREDQIKAIPHVSKLIADLFQNNFLLALASSSPLEQIDYILGVLNLKQYFHSISSGDEVEFGKPHPGIFLKAAQRVNVNPKDCIVIEDSCNGVMAAKKANMKCIAYCNPNSGTQNLNEASVIIHSFKELSAKYVMDLLRSEATIEHQILLSNF
jgi:HAD superfamily hydrolase (TIGR01509 family)